MLIDDDLGDFMVLFGDEDEGFWRKENIAYGRFSWRIEMKLYFGNYGEWDGWDVNKWA